MNAARTTPDEAELVRCILARMATDLSILLDRELELSTPLLVGANRRPAGQECVHISFKLAIEAGAQGEQGCLLVPLPAALSLADYLMMKPDEEVRRNRARADLDGPTKEALLEISKVLARACHAVLGRVVRASTRSGGCQGVRANVRPALAYREGDRLLIARVRARLAEFEPFELILVLPDPARILESVSSR